MRGELVADFRLITNEIRPGRDSGFGSARSASMRVGAIRFFHAFSNRRHLPFLMPGSAMLFPPA